jgi:parallel beta-helix repeat protein
MVPRLESWVFGVFLLGMAGTTLTVWNDQALAKSPDTLPAVTSKATLSTLLVNPVSGNDESADGSDRAPFKTITKALQVAKAGAVIQLVAGTYSAESGERFPLQMKAGVTIQGNSQTRGSDIIIRGSSFFLSPTSARQNVTLLGANEARLAGVTVTNPHPQGYGLWLESSSPTVTDNTFTGSGHDGISVVGKGAPVIRNNYFFKNGANGITVYGSSRPELRENIFEQTGFGININERSTPLIVGNRVTQNIVGIVVQAKARPTLRNNSIEDNQQGGLVAIGESSPDLGVTSEPGGNFIRNNGEFDVNVKRTSERVSAIGNEISRAIGDLAQAGENSSTAPQAAVTPISFGERLTAKNPFPLEPVSPIQTTSPNPLSAASPSTPEPVAVNPPASEPFPVPSSLAGREEPPPSRPLQIIRLGSVHSTAMQSSPPTGGSIPIAVPTIPVSIAPPSPLEPASKTAESAKTSSFTMPEATRSPSASPKAGAVKPLGTGRVQTISTSVPDILPVPNSMPPLGNVGRSTATKAPTRIATGDSTNPPLPPTRGSLSGIRYRVVVEAATTDQQTQVKTVVPGAFPTSFKGKMAMQAGAFGDREKADQLVQEFASQGLKAIVEPME